MKIYGVMKNMSVSAICAAIYMDSCTLETAAGVTVCALIMGGAVMSILTSLDRAFGKENK